MHFEPHKSPLKILQIVISNVVAMKESELNTNSFFIGFIELNEEEKNILISLVKGLHETLNENEEPATKLSYVLENF